MSSSVKAVIAFTGPAPRCVDVPQGRHTITLGRLDSDILLVGANTSRHHAQLKCQGSKVWLKDTSTHGTFENGQRLAPHTWHEWKQGQKFQFGRFFPGDTGRHDSRYDVAYLKVMAVGAQAEPSGAQKRGTKRPIAQCSGKRSDHPGVKCDKCDEAHPTDSCPHFPDPREDHKDSWVNHGRKNPFSMGADGGRRMLYRARVVRQPGDGSCLFHALCYGLNARGLAAGRGLRADTLRRQLMQFIRRSPHLQIAGDTLEEWIAWDSQSTVEEYARRMAISGWGGGIEMAACSILMGVNIHVYEARGNGAYERISCFNSPRQTTNTINVLYQGRMHFDAILL